MDEWIHVKVHPNAKKEALVQVGRARFEAWVKAKPISGMANPAVAKLVAKGLSVSVDQVRLVKGRGSRHKVFRLIGEYPGQYM